MNNPILNNPYLEPTHHYSTNENGELDYERIVESRRIFTPDINIIPSRQIGQKSIFTANDYESEYSGNLVNMLRKEIKKWRQEDYPNTTRITKELLHFWFKNDDRHATEKLFFAQQEAIETAIWLNEAIEKSNAGQNILRIIAEANKIKGNSKAPHLPRIAFKMATGTGKTVVMGAFIVYNYFNRQEYRTDVRFADYFLIVTPGITIKDRLGVLFVDKSSKSEIERNDYYFQRKLVPPKWGSKLASINSRLIITNYHSFERRTLQGNKRSPFDGKISEHNEQGKALKYEAKEDYNSVIKRALGKFKTGSRLLIMNDEAHHCYFPKSSGKTKDTESDENAKAAVWFTGVAEAYKKFNVKTVYDLSATPYYLQGSGYDAYSLFGWVVSDFGLIEAIESGLVKIPFLPETDNTQELTIPKLRDLYEHVKNDLPKKGQKAKRKAAREEGNELTEEPPKIPALVKGALDQFYNHYKDYYELIRKKGEENTNLFTRPPVFIAVCNNTSVSKEVYKFVAGYETESRTGESITIPGNYDLLSNYDKTGILKRKPPTLLIDSDALEDSNQVSADFKKIFASEIEEFKREYAQLRGQGAAERITDAEILREVVNTVGESGKLGAHIRCVVSVSMLTEGWDANTVTHIMGLRAFGSQLLCEQVAGRALRRMNYFLQGYDKDGKPSNDKRKIVIEKFPPEYAHIIGVPFKFFKGGTAIPGETKEYTYIHALKEREEILELTFPNVDGYRVEYGDDEIQYDFENVENFEIDGSQFPIETDMSSAFSAATEKLKVKSVLAKREQEIVFILTKELIKYHFADDDGHPKFQKFNKLKDIVSYWYKNKLVVLNIADENYKKLIFFSEPKTVVDHIIRGINTHINTSENMKPAFNYYNRFGSTKYVHGNTSKEVFATKKSHINFVVMDSDWEGFCAKTLEAIPEVISYVKNQFLGLKIPYVKDGKDKDYYCDFIARVKRKDGSATNLLIEISGMNTDKDEKKWFVKNRWLPAVNSAAEQNNYDRWFFIEIAGDIRNIRIQLDEKISEM
ncbi:MAG: DEAD/DEAH box helicase family protein [Bacteroidetes bacterium]|nr:DEAD/DEAH box helicase family protein [Bacteroidota bacterium]